MCIFIIVGNIYDSTQAEKLLHNTIDEGVYVIGDKAFDSEQIVKYIEKNRGICVIPPRKNRKEQREYNKDIYKSRNQIERFLNQLKQFRRIATRYDKLLFSFLLLQELFDVSLSGLPRRDSTISLCHLFKELH